MEPPSPEAGTATSPKREFSPFPRHIPYPSIEKHGVIGDRRTAVLVSADGTVDWLCLPDYDGAVIFGSLLDYSKGGYWQLGPATRRQGQQRYPDQGMVLETSWDQPEGRIALWDAMLWPETDRPAERSAARILVRRLRGVRGVVRCRFELRPSHNFRNILAGSARDGAEFALPGGGPSLTLWTSAGPSAPAACLHHEFELRAGEELWAILGVGMPAQGWSVGSARQALEETQQYWQEWLKGLRHIGAGREALGRAALTMHLLGYAPNGSVVAAPTTSLPERIGGDWNADYRLSWVRDSSLVVGMLMRLGDCESAGHYLQWLVERRARFGKPLQTVYGIRGETRPRERVVAQISGYRNSKPVRFGNHAYKQHQLGSLGFLADCAWLYLQEGGTWHEPYWKLIRGAADYVARHWRRPENAIWELAKPQQFVHGKVLSWVALDRAIGIARQAATGFDTSKWETERWMIHQEVMERGWSERLGAFRQRYDADNLDAASLLISVLGFLPGTHPRVIATLERIEERLTIDGFVYRFDPLKTPGLKPLPLGEMEGAFLPCTFWLATAYAKAGQVERAQAIVQRVETLAGPLGLFAEGVDPRTGGFLGNTPLLFSQAEYVRAKLEIQQAQDAAGLCSTSP